MKKKIFVKPFFPLQMGWSFFLPKESVENLVTLSLYVLVNKIDLLLSFLSLCFVSLVFFEDDDFLPEQSDKIIINVMVDNTSKLFMVV